MIVLNSDITKCKVDCIISPSNGLGSMNKGIASALNREGGPDVINSAKAECFRNGLYDAGEAYLGDSGFLRKNGVKKIIHAVIIKRSVDKPTQESCKKSLENALSLVKINNFKSVAIPAFGLNAQKNNAENMADLMYEIIKKYDELFTIYVIDANNNFIEKIKTKLR